MPNSDPAVCSTWVICEYAFLFSFFSCLQMLDTYAAGRSGDFIFLQSAINHLLINTNIKLQSLALCHTVVIPTFEEQEDSEFKASLCWITRFRFNNTNKQTTKITYIYTHTYTLLWSGIPLLGGWGSFCSFIDFLRDGSLWEKHQESWVCLLDET